MMSKAIRAPQLYQLSFGAGNCILRALLRSPPCILPVVFLQYAALNAKKIEGMRAGQAPEISMLT